MARGPTWTEFENEYLRNHCKARDYRLIAEDLGRTESSVRTQACRLGLNGRKFGLNHHRNRRYNSQISTNEYS